MSVATEQVFARRTSALWRDTGRHVLALPTEEGADVVVLGGGGAVLWRLLDRPAGLPDLMASLETAAGEAPAEGEVRECLQDLVERGLVTVAGSDAR